MASYWQREIAAETSTKEPGRRGNDLIILVAAGPITSLVSRLLKAALWSLMTLTEKRPRQSRAPSKCQPAEVVGLLLLAGHWFFFSFQKDHGGRQMKCSVSCLLTRRPRHFIGVVHLSPCVFYTSAVGHTKHMKQPLPYGTNNSGAHTKKSHYITITMMYRY